MKKASPRKLSITERFLDLFAGKPEGMRFSEIQRALWDMRVRSCHTTMPRSWWCTNLVGALYSHVGLLATYATKGSDGRWYRNSVAHEGKPWSKVERTPGSYRAGYGHKY